jgi:hypothetical protein
MRTLRSTCLSLAVLITNAAPAQDHAIITRDMRGALRACESCPEAAGTGGLARLTSLAAERRTRGETLVLDAGNALFGDAAGTGLERSTLGAYASLGLDAMNVSYRDFRLGKQATTSLLSEASFPVVSSNLYDVSTGERLFAPFALLDTSDGVVGVIGLTERPVALEYLPHLQEQLEGIEVRDPVSELGEQLGRLEGAVDRIWVLYYGSTHSLPDLREASRGRAEYVFAAAGSPGVSVEHLVSIAKPPYVTELQLSTGDAGRVLLDSTLPTGGDEPTEHPVGGAGPERAPLRAGDRGLRVAVFDAEVDGDQVVLDLELENRLPIEVVLSEELPEGLLFRDVTARICLVVDGWQVVRPTLEGAGALPRELVLPHIGARRRGTLSFSLPGPEPRHLELCIYHETCPPLSLALLGDAPEPGAAAALGTAHSEVLDLSVDRFELRTDGLPASTAPGSALAVVDVRGRSKLAHGVAAGALEPNATTTEELALGLTFALPEPRRTLRLRVDDRFVYAPLEAEPASLFLPGRFVGGTLTFVVPAEHRSLELEVALPELVYDHLAHPLRPSPMRVGVLEPDSPLEAVPGLAQLEGAPLRTVVHGWRLEASFAGQDADPDERFLVLDVSLTNEGDEGGLYEVSDRFSVLVDGVKLPLDPLTYAGLYRPTAELWIATGEHRAFELAFRIPGDVTAATLSYGGIQGVATFGLTLSDDATLLVSDDPPKEADVGTERAGGRVGQGGAGEIDRTASLAVEDPDQAAIDKAIERASEFLWERIHANEFAYLTDRENPLAMLALYHAGAFDEPGDRDAELARFLHEYTPYDKVYRLALMAMLLDADGRPSTFPGLESIARRFVEGVSRSGLYGYTVPRDPGSTEVTREVLEVLGGVGTPDPVNLDGVIPRIGDWNEVPRSDHSLTQFAVLGMRAAERRGFRVTPEVWRRIVEGFEARQQADGGWCYRPGTDVAWDGVATGSYGSATCAGVGTLAIALAALGEDPLENPALRRGLDWIDRHFSVEENPRKGDEYLYYYLYSIERVGQLLELEHIGRHPWYARGARVLLAAQAEDGSWTGVGVEEDPVIATSFALLFLTRKTEQARPAAEGQGFLTTTMSRPPAATTYVILDASGSMLTEADDGSRFDVARRALVDLGRALPLDTRLGLRAFGHRYSPLDERAATDTELVISIDEHDTGGLERRLATLRPRGKSPIGLSLRKAAGDVRSLTGEVSVLLLTNGGGLARGGLDPIAEAGAFVDLEHVRLHVVGFALDDPVTERRLERIAEAGGGLYWPADQARDLLEDLAGAALGRPERVDVLDHRGRSIAHASLGERLTIAAGEYTVRVQYRRAVFEREVWVDPARTTTVVFNPGVAIERMQGLASGAGGSACSACGQALGAEDRFCGECGRRTTQH